MDNHEIIQNLILRRTTGTPGRCYHCRQMTNESPSNQNLSKHIHYDCLQNLRVNNPQLFEVDINYDPFGDD